MSRSERPDLGAAKVVVAGTRLILVLQTSVMALEALLSSILINSPVSSALRLRTAHQILS